LGRQVREAVSVLRHIDAGADAVAVVAGDQLITYAELDRLVDAAAQRIGPARSLVAIAGENTVSALTAYLACLRHGHVALLVPPCTAQAITAVHSPDVTVAGGVFERRFSSSGRDLHPDLAVLLSTSGSTGNARLVRLSHSNISSNADSIVTALGITASDRAITTLSPAYSYGLSVINSHLSVGGRVVLTSESVTDDEFWRTARQQRATTLAGVPHTFDLLERMGFSGRMAPELRLLTCAGGRLAPDAVRRFAAVGRRDGFDLAVMYGQTEATARIACLPPGLADQFPESVGWPVPGGSVRLADVDDEGVGRLLYRGPNVMMGYAHCPADLARGAELTELDTGDRARIAADGRIDIIGRQDRFAKVFGYRIDLSDVDRALEQAGIRGASVAITNALGVVACADDPDRVRDVVAGACRIPAGVIRVVCVPELPRVYAGKPDTVALSRLVADAAPTPLVGDPVRRLETVYGRLLRRQVSEDDSFVSLGGDSLTFVAVSVEVERTLGHLPPNWHTRTIAELARQDHEEPARPQTSSLRQMDAGVVLRACAILAIVASHANLLDLRGGAHLLVALLGFNLARFPLSDPDRRRGMRSTIRHTAELLVPSVLWVGVLAAVTTTYSWSALGWNPIANPVTDNPDWRYWFVAAMVWILPVVVAVVALPQVDRLRRRYPFGFPLVLAVGAWTAFVLWVPEARPSSLFAPLAVLWIFLLGWAAAQAADTTRRLLLSAVILITVPISYDGGRMWTIPVLLLLLVWISRVPLPPVVAVAAAAFAEASLYIFLAHWQVLEVFAGWWALALSLVLGVVIQRGVAAVRSGVAVRSGSAAARAPSAVGRVGNPAGVS